MVGLLGKKLGQTRVYDGKGKAVSVTVVQCGPNRVVQLKTVEKDGYPAVQLGFDAQTESRLNKPSLGHFKKHGAEPCKRLKEFRDFDREVKAGDVIVAKDLFSAGDFVDVIGLTKGRGFQGVVKRWNFGGGPKTHGSKGFKRRPGSIGQRQWPGFVQKGKKMPGHMGQARRTVQNLEIIQIRDGDNVVLVKGAIPGASGDYVVVRGSKKKPKKAAEAGK